MRNLPLLLLSLSIGTASLSQSSVTPQQADSSTLIPAGTRIALAVIRPLWSSTAKPGDTIYSQTTFPVAVGDRMLVPSGSYVEGQIDSLTKPTRRSNHAAITVHFTKIILANGYIIELPSDPASDAHLDVQVSRANDLLLDNGAQIDMTTAGPIALDAARAAAAIPLSKPLQPGDFRSATLCRPTPGSPGTPGTPDTVIPGSPGTPSTTIPGGPGMPDIVIPGTPGTPSTTIPGTPGTTGSPGINCPAPPLVLSSTTETPSNPKHN